MTFEERRKRGSFRLLSASTSRPRVQLGGVGHAANLLSMPVAFDIVVNPPALGALRPLVDAACLVHEGCSHALAYTVSAQTLTRDNFQCSHCQRKPAKGHGPSGRNKHIAQSPKITFNLHRWQTIRKEGLFAGQQAL